MAASFWLPQGFASRRLQAGCPRSVAFVTLAAKFGGLIVGRLVSLVLNGGLSGYGPTIQALSVIDAIGFFLAIAAASLEWAGASRPGL